MLLPHTTDALLCAEAAKPLICTTGAKSSSMPRCKGIGMPKPKTKRVEQAEEHTIEEIEDDIEEERIEAVSEDVVKREPEWFTPGAWV